MGSLFAPPPAESHDSPPLTTSSPEDIFTGSDFPGPLHLSPISSIPTPIPASSDTSASTSTSATPRGSIHSSLSASIVNHRPDLASGLASRSRSSSLRQVYPSTSQTTTSPQSPRSEEAVVSVTSKHVEPTLPSPKKQSNGHPPGVTDEARNPGLQSAAKRNSQERRVRSESVVRRSSPMTHGKRTPLLTGGYATSESDTLSEGGQDEGMAARPSSSRAATSFFSTRHTQVVAQDKRRRAQTLMLPVMDDRSPSGEGSGSARSFGSSRSGRRRPDDIVVPNDSHDKTRQRSRSSSLARPQTTSRPSQIRQNGSNPPRSPLASNPPSRFPSAHFADSPTKSNRHSSYTFTRENTSRSPPQRTNELPARSGGVDRLRREEGVTSPEGSRKGKEKAHDPPPPKRSGLASSLLNATMSESASLTPGESSCDNPVVCD